ncbi:extracellular solute-binding protein [Paenibacillus cymbidii]|uniref:extracellular solute-binding protein n=1 Tax=Paenibacillus cymbidii TaxID=1639034 RepID=UPI001436CAD3|nr:extracellular solute-binding protein [Paenibacillus cymbidii]
MKKTGALLLTFGLSAGLFAGCSDSGNKNDTAASASPQTSASASASATPAKEKTAMSIEIDRWYPSTVDFPAADKNVILQQVKKDLNIDLKYTITNGKSDDWRAKLGTRVSANDLPDVIYFFNMADYRTASSQGYIVPLNDLFGMNNLPSNMGWVNQAMLNSMTDDNGKYYALPVRPSPSILGYFIRKDWLDALNLKVPETVEDFAKVATAFATQDPDKNGKKDTYGFTASGCMTCQDYWGLIAPFTGNTSPDEYIADGDTAVKGGFTSPQLRAYLQYMNKLMKDGALDPDIATNDGNRKTQKIEQGQAGIFMYTGDYPRAILANMKKLNPNADLVYVPAMTGPAGKFSPAPKSGVANAIGITVKAAKDPEKVKRIIELVSWTYGGVGQEMMLFGEEGVNYKKANGKVAEIIEGKQNDYLSVYGLNGGVSTLFDDPDVLKLKYKDPKEMDVIKQMIASVNKTTSVYALGAKERPDLMNDIKKYREEMLAKFIYGTVSTDDAGWNDYVKTHDEKYKGNQVREAMMNDLKKAGVIK